MPVNYMQSENSADVLYQRDQYKKGGIAKRYWDYRDKVIVKSISEDADVILDAGCGEGITLEKICGAFGGRRVIGLDIIDDNVSICKKHGLPVSKGDIYHLEMPDKSVDCCVFSEVIEHLDDPKSALLEVKRVLNPGGRLIVVFPNDLTFKLARIITLKFKEAFYDAGHLIQWSPKSIKLFLKQHGFEVLKQVNIPFYLWHLSLHHLVVCRKEK
jgi:ubiquinone/menaquinone biosynthesis C-methylase UbiE